VPDRSFLRLWTWRGATRWSHPSLRERRGPGVGGAPGALRPCTLVSLHAHPDDEALLTGGTLALAAAAGHRVVLVYATRGEAGLAADATGLGERREAETRAAAAALRAARVVHLGYADSGLIARPDEPGTFASAPLQVAAERVAQVLRQEQADVLTTYDARGGYGHPDHVRVHQVGARAADLAGTPLVLEATVPREALQRAVRLVQWLPGLPSGFTSQAVARAYSPRAEITHAIDVRPVLDAKRAALAAHQSQQSAPSGRRTLSVLLALPTPLARLVLGREWFIQRGRVPSGQLQSNIFDALPTGVTAPGDRP